MKDKYRKNIERLLRGVQSRELGKALMKSQGLSEEEQQELLSNNPAFGARKVGPGIRQMLRDSPIPYSGISKKDLEDFYFHVMGKKIKLKDDNSRKDQ